MNKIVFFAAAVLLLFSACKKKKETEPELYYMVFSADGVPSSFYEVSGLGAIWRAILRLRFPEIWLEERTPT